MSFRTDPGEVSDKVLPNNRQIHSSQPTLVMNKILPWALKPLSDPLLMTLPVTGLLLELVFNHRPAMTSEVWCWPFQRVLGEGWLMFSATEESHEQFPRVPTVCILQPSASRGADTDLRDSPSSPKPHGHKGFLETPYYLISLPKEGST